MLALLSLPLIWLYGFGVAGLALVLDLLALPFIGRRQPPADLPLASRDASVIILNWNGEGYLRELLPSVKVAVERAAGDHEVIVVDNGSTDGSGDLVRQDHPWVRLVCLPRNLFFIGGNRAGVQAATRDILVFLNNDMRVEPEFLVELLAPFGPPDLFAVTARIEIEGGSEETGRTRGCFGRSQLYHVKTERGGDLIPVLWAGGGSSAFDRAKYLELGGFEDLYSPCYVEDVSLCYQAWRRGWRSLHAPGSVVHHLRRGTSERLLGGAGLERLQYRNRELFFWRSVTDPTLLLARAFHLPWDLMKGARMADFPLRWAALANVLLRLPRALLARERGRPRYRLSDREVLRRACHVSLHRRAVVSSRSAHPTVLALGATQSPLESGDGFRVERADLRLPAVDDPPPEDLFRLLPRRFWNAARNGPFRDQVRDLLHEVDYDLVLFEDPWTLAAAEPHLQGVDALLWLEDLPDEDTSLERARRDRLLLRLARRARAVISDGGRTAVFLRRAGLRVVGPQDVGLVVRELVGWEEDM